MKYCFPAVFVKEDAGYSVEFPDIENCFTCGETLEEAMEMAEDALAMMLTDMEDNRQPIPAASEPRQVKAPEDAIVTLVLADTAEYRRRTSNMAIKKTLTIPQWLNVAAEKANVNFSQTLQEALTAKLGLG
ncbi:MAG: type II toxin-antitoxin system HicB family antitoxin [Clostridiales bacterium]|nr:type II toxin-antitoxin system HicB family antitoxin [Clostridiales bacterium]